MPLNSVNTNVGAMIALQNLNSTNSELATVQGRINTGKKVAGPRTTAPSGRSPSRSVRTPWR
jgi:flagellin